MKKAAIIIATASLVAPAAASASCDVACLSAKVDRLAATVASDHQVIAREHHVIDVLLGITSCTNEVPLTARQDGTITLTAKGGKVSAWVPVDMCNGAKTSERSPLQSLTWPS